MNQMCKNFHGLFSGLTRFRYPFDTSVLPLNGIYVIFEDKELGHEGNRIVRIGTHTSDQQLPLRLNEHFVKANKDRSIFRRHIGRAILNKEKDPLLGQWNLKARDTRGADLESIKAIELRVSEYLQSSFFFSVFRIDAKAIRLQLESKIISTVSLCEECSPSEKWLGLHSPKEKIRESGLWLINHLYKKENALTNGDYDFLKASGV